MIHVKRFGVGLLILMVVAAMWLASEWLPTWPDSVMQALAWATVALLVLGTVYAVGYLLIEAARPIR